MAELKVRFLFCVFNMRFSLKYNFLIWFNFGSVEDMLMLAGIYVAPLKCVEYHINRNHLKICKSNKHMNGSRVKSNGMN